METGWLGAGAGVGASGDTGCQAGLLQERKKGWWGHTCRSPCSRSEALSHVGGL